MLIQSHETYIRPLPSLPDAWADGSYTGLAARGGFTLDAAWKNGCAETITVHSISGESQKTSHYFRNIGQ